MSLESNSIANSIANPAEASRPCTSAEPQPLETQINAITASIERLNQSVGEMKLGLEEIRRDQSLVVASSRLTGGAENYADFSSVRSSYLSESERNHKDILEDADDWSGQGNTDDGRNLSPEIQIQRLTAQLTAAYSRIAALEEQLLARRVH